MNNSLYRPISKGIAGAKIPLASDVAQFVDLFNANADVGILSLAGPIATLSTGSISLALASGGTLGIGVYRYKFTFVSGLIQADGTPIIYGETPGSVTLTITTTSGNQKVTISGLPAIGTWPVTAIGIRIYRTLVGGADATQKLVTTLFTNYLETTFVTSYLDGIADGSLGVTVPTINTTGTSLVLSADPSTALGAVTKQYADAINAALIAHEADYTLQVPYGGATTGPANTYALAAPAITALTAGMAVSVKFNVDSTGASTLNWNGKGAKGIKKANGNDVTNLHATGIYTLRYDGTNFILQGEGGSGNAAASDLLSGKTASTDVGDIVGTMPDLSNVTIAATSTAPAGWVQRPGQDIMDVNTLANQTGKVSPTTVYQAGFVNLVAKNIKAGIHVGDAAPFGIDGTFTSDATAGAGDISNGQTAYINGVKVTGTGANAKRKAKGTLTSGTAPAVFTVNTLNFQPNLVVIETTGSRKIHFVEGAITSANDQPIAGTTIWNPDVGAITILSNGFSSSFASDSNAVVNWWAYE